jgi:murein L,D-transpeptidase YcbB/YkuD
MATSTHFISNRSVPFASGHANRSARPRGTPTRGWFGQVRRVFGHFRRIPRLGAVVLCTVAAAANAAGSTAPSPDEVAHRLEQLVSSGTDATIRFAAPDVLQRFYQQRDFALAWDDARAQGFVEVVRTADTQGLSPADYLAGELTALPPLSSLGGNARIDADLELTEALLRYAYHSRFGKVDPRELDSTWNYARSVSAGGPYSALERIIAAPDLAAQLAEEVGHGAMYDALRRVLARYRGYVAAGGWQQVPAGPTLKPGSTDARVAALRQRLAAEGFLAPAAGDPNTFDEGLANAVRDFQTHRGLGPDGVVGAKTLNEINVSANDLVDRLRVNLERLRWVLVERTPRFVAVNIAGFRVYYVDDDRVQWTARAMVGKPYRATPIFRADMTYLVINPDWTVPPTILRNDSLPAIKRDRAYLDKQRMDVIDRNGRVVDPATIDWETVTPKTFPYMLRQRSGPTNALGRIKFMFPNEHFVFLHDTPSRDLFDRDERAFSSGCIRVEHPFELAELLLRPDPKWTPDVLQRVVDSETMQTVKLPRPLPVLILYLTAIAFDEGREFTFLRDIYGRDASVLRALNAGFVYSPPAGL